MRAKFSRSISIQRLTAAAVALCFSAGLLAQGPPAQAPGQAAAQRQRPLSPADTASTLVGGEWVKNAQGNPVYQGGKWIEVIYSRPMLRQREKIFGSGAEYGKAVIAGAPMWRVGANATTVFRTEVPLVFDGKTLPAGEYGLLADLNSAEEWTLIFTSQPRQKEFDANNKSDLIGATNYDPKFDVLRVKMGVDQEEMRVDQLTIFFADVKKDRGVFGIAWDKAVAGVEFSVAPTAPDTAPVQPSPHRPLSPPGIATAVLGGDWVKNAEGREVYQHGKWIELRYNRPMLRQRPNIFSTGADYGKAVLGGAPVWRVGADQSTRFKSEVPLVFGGKTLPAGEYSMFVDLKENAWTLMFSTWPAQQRYNADDKTSLWESYGYTPDKDVVRVPMQTDSSGLLWPSIDQLTIFFSDVKKDSGKMVITWDKTVALADFTVGKPGL